MMPSFPGFQARPQQPQQVAPPPWQATAPPARNPVPAAMAAQNGNPERPKIRMQAPETLLPDAAPHMPPQPQTPAPQPTRLTLPSPEQLGVSGTGPAPVTSPATALRVDWNDLRARLERLGALGLHLDKLAIGYRVAFLLPTNQPDRAHHIEATADTEAAAIRLALQRAEAWVGGGR
jgi:hypothetical protein